MSIPTSIPAQEANLTRDTKCGSTLDLSMTKNLTTTTTSNTRKYMFLPKSGIISDHFSAKISYQVHAKNRYKTHPRSPAIGQKLTSYLILARKGQGMPVFFCCLLRSFQLILPKFEPVRAATYVHCFFSPCAFALPW